MAELAPIASQIIHFTGYERPIARRFDVPNLTFRLLGNMLGTADIIAQMADRCYLEKCRDRLYPEFVEGGLAARDDADHRTGVMFTSAEDLVTKTPNFYKTATVRLNDQLGSAYGYADKHFGGQNLYLDEIDKNIHYATEVAEQRDLSLLRREPPNPGEDRRRRRLAVISRLQQDYLADVRARFHERVRRRRLLQSRMSGRSPGLILPASISGQTFCFEATALSPPLLRPNAGATSSR